MCCDSWGRKESDMTERLIRPDKLRIIFICLRSCKKQIIICNRHLKWLAKLKVFTIPQKKFKLFLVIKNIFQVKKNDPRKQT